MLSPTRHATRPNDGGEGPVDSNLIGNGLVGLFAPSKSVTDSAFVVKRRTGVLGCDTTEMFQAEIRHKRLVLGVLV